MFGVESVVSSIPSAEAGGLPLSTRLVSNNEANEDGYPGEVWDCAAKTKIVAAAEKLLCIQWFPSCFHVYIQSSI